VTADGPSVRVPGEERARKDKHRRIAVLVGALFLTATVSGLIVVASWGPVLDASDPLAEVIGSDAQVRVGAIFELVMGVAVAPIALAMYPALREHDETLALGYVVARAIEGAFIILPAVTMLSLATLGRGVAGSGVSADPSVIAAGTPSSRSAIGRGTRLWRSSSGSVP
jgi:hypothetical protein